MADFSLARALLNVPGAEDDGAQYHPDGHESRTLDLRIASIFVILVGALLGGLPTLFTPRLASPDDVLGRLLRTFSGGVILALGLVHIAPEAVEALDSLMSEEYPLGGVVIVGGLLLILLFDTVLHSHYHLTQPDMSPMPDGKRSKDVVVPHAHGCLREGGAEEHIVRTSADPIKQQLVVYTMEAGCVFHSFVIGLGLGVTVSDKDQVVALLIALTFHQMLEAVSLASLIALAHMSKVKGVAMILVYSLTTPVGIAIGIGISDAYDPESRTARAVEGSLNALSAGMLIYIAVLQLLGEEFSRLGAKRDVKLRWMLFAAALVGAALMCVLAIWA